VEFKFFIENPWRSHETRADHGGLSLDVAKIDAA
jgi:hypothetical protein